MFLFLLTLVGLAFFTPWLGLVGDDWWFFAHLSDGQFIATQLYENPARPLVAYLWAGWWRIFGLHLWAYYGLSFAVQWLSSVAVFGLLRHHFAFSRLEAVTGAAFFLLYPADTAHAYLSTLSTRVCVLLAVAGAGLWLSGARRSARLSAPSIAGLGLMAGSLLAYETPLLLIAALPLALVRSAWRGWRHWLWQAGPCYAVVVAYGAFRWAATRWVALRPDHYYVALDFSPSWVAGQIWALLAAITWKGWLYTLKVLFDLQIVPATVLLLAAFAVLLPFLVRWGREPDPRQRGGLRAAQMILVGLLLAAAGVAPVVFSNVRLNNAVGTLDGRLLHAAALGGAIAIVGLCGLAAAAFRSPVRTLVQATLMALGVALALVDGVGTQREYAQAWQSQMQILRSLQNYAPTLRPDTTILLLDVPAQAFEIRFYYPFTELARRFYADGTLQVLPWQRGFPPEQQPLAFGTEGAVALTEVVRGDMATFGYDQMIGFQVLPSGQLEPLAVIPAQDLTPRGQSILWAARPPGWQPAQTPVTLRPVAEATSAAAPESTAWRQWLQGQLAFQARFPLPGGGR